MYLRYRALRQRSENSCWWSEPLALYNLCIRIVSCRRSEDCSLGSNVLISEKEGDFAGQGRCAGRGETLLSGILKRLFRLQHSSQTRRSRPREPDARRRFLCMRWTGAQVGISGVRLNTDGWFEVYTFRPIPVQSEPHRLSVHLPEHVLLPTSVGRIKPANRAGFNRNPYQTRRFMSAICRATSTGWPASRSMCWPRRSRRRRA